MNITSERTLYEKELQDTDELLEKCHLLGVNAKLSLMERVEILDWMRKLRIHRSNVVASHISDPLDTKNETE